MLAWSGVGDMALRADGPHPSYHSGAHLLERPAVVSVPGISSSQPISGVYPSHFGHDRKSLPPAPAVVADSSTAGAEPLASAIASALTQLGLIPTMSAAGGTVSTGDASNTPLLQRQSATQPIEQYRSMVSSSSQLAQALSASTSSANGGGNLPTVFQSLWTSLGASSNDASSGSMPSLPSFLNTLARNLSESGVTGLRGVFVDTVA